MPASHWSTSVVVLHYRRRDRSRHGVATMLDRAFHDRIDADFAWDLVERFSGQPRERPADVNRGADIIAEHLQKAGIPVTMHEPTLFLSLPGPASVEIGGRR